MLCPSTGPKLFWADYYLQGWPKCFGPDQKLIYILYQSQTFFATPKVTYVLPFSKFGFCAGIKLFEEAQNTIKFLDWLKQFGLAQNILGPVEGQRIKFSERHVSRQKYKCFFSKDFNPLCKTRSFSCAVLLAQCYHQNRGKHQKSKRNWSTKSLKKT